ncbi:WD domain protein [Paraphaeosphaeria sporulosa]
MSSSPCTACLSELPSSPPPAHVANAGSRKVRKPPPITPKRFQKFFTPRTSSHGSSRLSSSGRQLQDITRAAINRGNAAHRTTPRKTVNFADIEVDKGLQTPQLSSRKRKTPYLSPESSPAQSSPTKRHKYATPPPFNILEDAPVFDEPPVPIFPEPIRRLKSLGGTSRKLTRSFGGILSVGRGLRRDHCAASWQDHTVNFYSSAEDHYELPQGAPPFCTASCNVNSLVAVGDEDGWVHLLDSEDDKPTGFSKAHVSWRAHGNAIMDIQFSSDDSWIATASGDQTGQIIDARTQQTVHVLAKHKSSVKQIRFQPGDDNIVATSSRDGAVQIWDLRCKGGHTNVHPAWGDDVPYASTIKSLASAHADPGPISDAIVNTKSSANRKSEALSRRNDVSVTALSFLPTGRQHLLLTASDASTSVKLWDIRGRYSLRGPAVPISTTRHPESHTRHRHFAINSLTLSGDAARLYALSKDNTVYAYSTSHLILGVAPELSSTTSKHQRAQQDGLGPIYGFRHRNFHAGSFYVKASLRKASDDKPELLAVGSTDGCPVLFPTDETFLKRENTRTEEFPELPQLRRSSRPTLARNASTGSKFPCMLTDTIPIYEHGTPLIRGHDAEVTSVSWTKSGSLISVGDDFRVRRWNEGSRARELRLNGEAEGKRWQCGWAVAPEGYDEDDFSAWRLGIGNISRSLGNVNMVSPPRPVPTRGLNFPGSFFLLSHEADEFQCPTPSNAGLMQMFPKESPPTWIGSAPWLWTTFARPVAEAQFSQSYLPKQSKALAPIERLPNELLDQVLTYIQDEERDVLAWGLSSNVIWAYVLRLIHKQNERFVGLWSCKEVGFYGYIPTSDDDVFQCRSVWDRRPAMTNAPDFLETYNVDERRLSDVTITAAQRWTEVLDAAKFLSRSQAPGWAVIKDADWRKIERDLFFRAYPQSRTWVLRNLTTSEFIRSDKLTPSARKSSDSARPKLPSRSSTFIKMLKPFASDKKTGKDKAPESLAPGPSDDAFSTSPLTFAQLLLTLTAHSDLPSHHELVFAFHDGRWRGHCFDLVPLSSHLSETKEADWADVSELAVDDVANLRYWVHQLNGDGDSCPKGLKPHVEADRNMYHNWEGLEAPLLGRGERPRGRWMLKKPMQTGVLMRAAGGSRERL